MKKKQTKSLVMICRDERGRFCKYEPGEDHEGLCSCTGRFMQFIGCMLLAFIIAFLVIVALISMGILYW